RRGCTRSFSGRIYPENPVIGSFWAFNDGSSNPTAIGTNVSHTFPGPGTYSVCFTAVMESEDGCCTITHCEEVVIEECAEGDEGKRAGASSNILRQDQAGLILDLYPNPSEDAFTLEYSVEERVGVTLLLYNISGKVVKTIVNYEEQ